MHTLQHHVLINKNQGDFPFVFVCISMFGVLLDNFPKTLKTGHPSGSPGKPAPPPKNVPTAF
jgi:hypothetical protein